MDEQRNWLKVHNCPLCDGQEFMHFESVVDEGIKIRNVICHVCGMVFQNPRLTDDALDDYYQTKYIRQHQKADQVTRKEQGMQSARAKHLTGFVIETGYGVQRHLDIGASTGKLMQTTSEILDCETIGVEPSQVYLNYAREQGLDVYESLNALAQQNRERFDLISLAHVLEHIPEPRDFLQNLRDEWLTAKGLLLVEVPNLIYHHSFELPHLSSYYRSSLSGMLSASGFQEVFFASHGYPRSRRIPLYMVSIATPQTEFEGEHWHRVNVNWIRLRRYVGRLSYTAAAKMVSLMKGKDAMQLEKYYERIATEQDTPDGEA